MTTPAPAQRLVKSHGTISGTGSLSITTTTEIPAERLMVWAFGSRGSNGSVGMANIPGQPVWTYSQRSTSSNRNTQVTFFLTTSPIPAGTVFTVNTTTQYYVGVLAEFAGFAATISNQVAVTAGTAALTLGPWTKEPSLEIGLFTNQGQVTHVLDPDFTALTSPMTVQAGVGNTTYTSTTIQYRIAPGFTGPDTFDASNGLLGVPFFAVIEPTAPIATGFTGFGIPI